MYDVYQAAASDGQSFSSATHTTAAGAPGYTVTGLAPGTSYFFVVRARDAAGNRDANTAERSALTATYTFSQTLNVSPGFDLAVAVVVKGDAVFVAGDDAAPGNSQWRLEKRDRDAGTLMSTFDGDGVVQVNPSSDNDRINGLAADANHVYIAGNDWSTTNAQWRIEKRTVATGALDAAFGSGGVVLSNPTTGNDAPIAMAIDGTYLYVGGVENGGSDIAWRVEKRTKITGALVAAFDSDGVLSINNAPADHEWLAAIAVDGEAIYLAGYDYALGGVNGRGRLEKRDINSGALIGAFGSSGVVLLNPSTSLDRYSAIALASSSIYVAGGDNGPGNGQMRLEKRDATTGALVAAFGSGGVVTVNPSGNFDSFTSIAIDSGHVYAGGFDQVVSATDGEWYVEKWDLTNGAPASGFSSSGVLTVNPSAGDDRVRSLDVRGGYLYLVGEDITAGNGQLRIEKRLATTGGL